MQMIDEQPNFLFNIVSPLRQFPCGQLQAVFVLYMLWPCHPSLPSRPCPPRRMSVLFWRDRCSASFGIMFPDSLSTNLPSRNFLVESKRMLVSCSSNSRRMMMYEGSDCRASQCSLNTADSVFLTWSYSHGMSYHFRISMAMCSV